MTQTSIAQRTLGTDLQQPTRVGLADYWRRNLSEDFQAAMTWADYMKTATKGQRVIAFDEPAYVNKDAAAPKPTATPSARSQGPARASRRYATTPSVAGSAAMGMWRHEIHAKGKKCAVLTAYNSIASRAMFRGNAVRSKRPTAATSRRPRSISSP